MVLQDTANLSDEDDHAACSSNDDWLNDIHPVAARRPQVAKVVLKVNYHDLSLTPLPPCGSTTRAYLHELYAEMSLIAAYWYLLAQLLTGSLRKVSQLSILPLYSTWP